MNTISDELLLCALLNHMYRSFLYTIPQLEPHYLLKMHQSICAWSAQTCISQYCLLKLAETQYTHHMSSLEKMYFLYLFGGVGGRQYRLRRLEHWEILIFFPLHH